MKKVLTLAVLLCLHTSALAAEPGPPAPLVEAIARQESGLNPLAVNIAGKPYYPATQEEAEKLIRKAIAAGQSFDVGKMQVNSWWMERFAIDPFSLLDPATNERWGKWILAEEIARHDFIDRFALFQLHVTNLHGGCDDCGEAGSVDVNHLAATCEVVQRPTMRLVPNKSQYQADIQLVHRVCGGYIREKRRQLTKPEAAAENGIVIPQAASTLGQRLCSSSAMDPMSCRG